MTAAIFALSAPAAKAAPPVAFRNVRRFMDDDQVEFAPSFVFTFSKPSASTPA
jgi:hypothetical protein